MDISDHWLLISGMFAAAAAAIAWVADLRRARRRHLDHVGFMPWTGLFFWSLLAAVLLLGAALKMELGG